MLIIGRLGLQIQQFIQGFFTYCIWSFMKDQIVYLTVHWNVFRKPNILKKIGCFVLFLYTPGQPLLLLGGGGGGGGGE